MLHIRLVSPATLTGRLSDRLTAIPGVQNVVIHGGAARRPDGDDVQFDVGDETANPVLAALRDMGLDRAGGICVERVDAVLTDPGQRDASHGVLRRQTAPVWEMVDAAIRREQAYTPSFYILLAIAGCIGAVGSITNRRCPSSLPWSSAGIQRHHRCGIRHQRARLPHGQGRPVRPAVGIPGRHRRHPALRPCRPGIRRDPAPFLAGDRPVADFINRPDEFSVIVAVLAGIVGVVSWPKPAPTRSSACSSPSPPSPPQRRWACRSRTQAGATPKGSTATAAQRHPAHSSRRRPPDAAQILAPALGMSTCR